MEPRFQKIQLPIKHSKTLILSDKFAFERLVMNKNINLLTKVKINTQNPCEVRIY